MTELHHHSFAVKAEALTRVEGMIGPAETASGETTLVALEVPDQGPGLKILMEM